MFEDDYYFDRDDQTWKNIILSKHLHPDEIYDTWVVCSPYRWGGHPYFVTFSKEDADRIALAYYDDSTIQHAAETDEEVLGIHPGPAQVFRVPMAPLSILVKEIQNDNKPNANGTER